jgi:hypothetical protein
VKRIVTIITVIVLVAVAGLSPFFIKVKVVCRSQYGDCPQDLSSALASESGKSLFNAKRSARKTLKSSLLVFDYSTQLKLPNVLVIDVLVKKPAFALKDSTTGDLYLVGTEGSVLSTGRETTLPVVSGTGLNLSVGQKATSGQLFALKLMSGVFDMYQVGNGEMADGSLVVELPPQIKVIFPLEADDPAVLLGALRLIYAKIESGAGNAGGYTQIDLRFENPVLR